uniref:Uncharacterized protein n=1 Tax=Oryza sativa subsp. japonica TaxID=39947 RepID=Q6K6K2_ORYSJ|nr:hypothetical protein [Oryza sativa Japonica Group]
MALLEEELRYLMVHQTVQLDPTGIFSLRRLSLGSMDDGCGAGRTTTAPNFGLESHLAILLEMLQTMQVK